MRCCDEGKMSRRMLVIVCGTVLLIAVVVVVALRNRQQPAPTPNVPVAVSPAGVRVKVVEWKTEPVAEGEVDAASGAVAIVCGEDVATAGRYEARNDALRSIARRRDLTKDDIDALLAYLREQDDNMRVERVAALKNDVMNLLRNQDPPAEGLVETLIAMFEGKDGNCEDRSLGCSKAASALPQGRGRPCHIGLDATTHNSSTHNSKTSQHPPVVLDYCIQHLGAMVNELDDATRVGGPGVPALPNGGVRGATALPNGGVRGVLVKAAGDKTKPYAGTALYSLAEDRRATSAQEAATKRGPPVLRTHARRARRRPRRSAALPS